MTPFAIFFLRQFFLGINRELEEAAMIDGAGHRRIFFGLIIPMSAAPIATLAILTYINSWNDYFWPLLVGQQENVRVLTVALGVFRSQTPQGGPDWAGLMAATLIAALPMIILFLLRQADHQLHRLLRDQVTHDPSTPDTPRGNEPKGTPTMERMRRSWSRCRGGRAERRRRLRRGVPAAAASRRRQCRHRQRTVSRTTGSGTPTSCRPTRSAPTTFTHREPEHQRQGQAVGWDDYWNSSHRLRRRRPPPTCSPTTRRSTPSSSARSS